MKAVNLSLSFGTNIIYESAEFNLLPRDKVGVVGVNGAGKTTLFKIILGNIPQLTLVRVHISITVQTCIGSFLEL